ncbi:MAG: UDP-2,3-diacylglucosamine diphosphatase LpxI [Acidobacteria bacterium]|nr:UDP-2,3-diacylglucosamine diphosphatase LpxI [Acidobacteriota bacterium]
MKFGLIAGNGRFPFLVLEGARAEGVEMAVAAIKEETDPKIEKLATVVEWISVGHLNKLIKFFKREGVTHAVMAGQVKHVQIFKLNALPDWRMARMLARLKRRNTDALIGAVAEELESEGMKVIDSTTFLQPLIAREGVLTKRAPNKHEIADIEYGLHVAVELARLNLGQTIVVKNQAVVAVEAMEGTDSTIRRAAELVRGRALTVVKVARTDQDMRFDVPVIGLNTVETLRTCNVTAISLTAEKTLIFDRDETIASANQNRIAIIALASQALAYSPSGGIA